MILEQGRMPAPVPSIPHWWLCSLVVASLLCVPVVSTALPIVVEVDARASGMFGGIPPLPTGENLVHAFDFASAGQTMLITATGLISLIPGVIDNVSPGGIAPLNRAAALGGGYLPLEEASVDSGGTLPTLAPQGGALMGAFVPASIVANPSFTPKDEDFVSVGIPSSALFFVGSGPTAFSAPGPGSLFLGINDPRADNNIGSFTASLNPVPEPATLFLVGTTVAGWGLARWRQQRKKRQTDKGAASLEAARPAPPRAPRSAR